MCWLNLFLFFLVVTSVNSFHDCNGFDISSSLTHHQCVYRALHDFSSFNSKFIYTNCVFTLVPMAFLGKISNSIQQISIFECSLFSEQKKVNARWWIILIGIIIVYLWDLYFKFITKMRRIFCCSFKVNIRQFSIPLLAAFATTLFFIRWELV